jgi:hypothetical protein
MPARYLALVLLCGCASVRAPESPDQRALNSCFFGADQKGWSFLEVPPLNADQLKSLIPSRPRNAAVLDDGYQQMWFKHTDGRFQVCSLFDIRTLPAVCSNLKYEFIRGTNGWRVKEEPPVVCY